jgi:agmatine deiminase
MAMQGALGGAYAMPAEWVPHERTWVVWPHRVDTWRAPGSLAGARATYAAVVAAIADHEPVSLVVPPSLSLSLLDQESSLAAAVRAGRVTAVPLPTSDSWVRDSGPSFLLPRQRPSGGARVETADGDGDGDGGDSAGLAATAWRFNGWGGLLGDDYADDAALASRICEAVGARCFRAPIVLEGGAFHVDGDGTVLATAECLLHPNRNSGVSKAEIEHTVLEYTGSQRMIWLNRGYDQDETSGHVDEAACFAAPGTVLLNMTDDASDANYAIFRENLAILEAARDALDRPLSVRTLPIPKPLYRPEGERLTLSYTNFYLCNGAVIMMTFGDDQADTSARAILRESFPERTVVPIPALNIVYGGGGIHCITQQQPRLPA